MFTTRIVYYLIVSICISISLYLTYFGFERTLNELTLPFTIVIGLVLFLADYLVQKYRESGQSIALPLVLFVMGAFFSMTSNFNFVYTKLMTRDVAAETIREQYDVFRDDLISTRASLVQLSAVQTEINKRELINTELENMLQQATDPNRPGCGQRCREHIANINAQLTIPPTDLQVPSRVEAFSDYYDRYTQLVFEAMDAEPSASTYVSVRAIQRQIEDALKRYNSPQDAIQTLGLAVLSEIATISQDVERRANSLLSTTQQVSHRKIDPSAGRLGEIIYTLQNGFVDRPNLSATLIAAIIASFVDILPIVVALIAFRRGVNLGGSANSSRPGGLL
ncbi:hypothetical protein [Yoonia sp. R2-816]|uniref:hypothetical protein n=1 Tax=Yoonia sp. R2-816 TaxID=3342638 RepID=UPI00372CAF24